MPSLQTPHLSLIAAGGSPRGMPSSTAPPLQAVPMTLPSSSAPRPPHLLTLAVATPSAVPRVLPSPSAGACCQRQVLQGHKREQCAVASATAATEARATAAAAAATTAIADATVNARVDTHAVLGAPRASCEWPRTGTCLTWTPTRAAPGAGTAGQLNLEPSQLQLHWLRHRPTGPQLQLHGGVGSSCSCTAVPQAAALVEGSQLQLHGGVGSFSSNGG